jgi:hypothetical protein
MPNSGQGPLGPTVGYIACETKERVKQVPGLCRYGTEG